VLTGFLCYPYAGSGAISPETQVEQSHPPTASSGYRVRVGNRDRAREGAEPVAHSAGRPPRFTGCTGADLFTCVLRLERTQTTE